MWALLVRNGDHSYDDLLSSWPYQLHYCIPPEQRYPDHLMYRLLRPNTPVWLGESLRFHPHSLLLIRYSEWCSELGHCHPWNALLFRQENQSVGYFLFHWISNWLYSMATSYWLLGQKMAPIVGLYFSNPHSADLHNPPWHYHPLHCSFPPWNPVSSQRRHW